jgi:hypothetical protein
MRDRKGQVLVGFKCDPGLQLEISKASGGIPVSQFLREAIVEKLHSMGFSIDPTLAKAPSRAGVGGPKPRPKKLKKKKSELVKKPELSDTGHITETE